MQVIEDPSIERKMEYLNLLMAASSRSGIRKYELKLINWPCSSIIVNWISDPEQVIVFKIRF